MRITYLFGIICLVVIILAMTLGQQVLEVVYVGEYKLIQNVFTGKIDACMKSGNYWQWFGKVYEYPVADTFYFTADKEGDTKSHSGDYSIHVQFMDGSTCDLSGTCRVEYPKTDIDAIALVKDHGYKNAADVEDRLILPVVRRALMMSANFITAKESYSDKRADFISEAWDQVQNGVYVTKDQEVKELDILSGQQVTRIRKVKIVDEKTGKVMREKNPLEGIGINLTNFEIKKFIYSKVVTDQIEAQQKALMGVQTAKANAQEAEQRAITAEASGKADVMKAKYEKEQEKIKAVVDAEKEKEVAETLANKEKEVAVIGAQKLVAVAEQNKLTAEIQLKISDLEKQSKILQAEGESTYKNKVFMADGGLVPKLETLTNINKVWADAYATRKVPTIVSGGSGKGGTDADTLTFMDLLTAKTAKDLAFDLDIKGMTPTVDPVAPVAKK